MLNKHKDKSKPLVAISLAMAFMVIGYFLATAFILGLFDESFGLVVAVNDSISTLVQAVISAVVGFAIISTGFVKKLQNDLK